MKKYITSESVSYGHPDKLADQISDSILDAYLTIDPNTKAGIETMIKDNIVVLGGEISSTVKDEINVEPIIKNVLKNAGYNAEKHLDPDSIKIINLLGKQSPEINNAVVKSDGEIGSGDQGIMFGYAINETPNLMPLDIYLAKEILNLVLSNDDFGPDAKSQVTIVEENGVKTIDSILVSTMHNKNISIDFLRNVLEKTIKSYINNVHEISKYLTNNTKIFINPAGSWNVGGPVSDCGLTGRKIVVDQYGANCPVGGGAFSGKDGNTKTDRSASYVARYIAKNIVASGLLEECKVELSYMIGVPEPSSIRISGKKNLTDDNEIVLDDELTNKIITVFPLTPKQISNHFGLKQPIYYNTAKNGHFGCGNYGWEKLDKVNEILDVIN
jgi:S-adenosylmethionine synthetase